MRSLWRIAIALTVVAAGCGKSHPAGPDGGANQCQIKSSNEKTPGFPYDLNTFSSVILPLLTKSCATSGCHDQKSAQANFIVYGGVFKSQDPQKACAFAESFNTFNTFTDLKAPENSKVYLAVSKGDPAHPPVNVSMADQMAILSYIQAAAKNNGGNTKPPTGSNCFDKTSFAQIQSAFDSATPLACTNASCHGAKTTAGGNVFFINANAMPGTTQFTDNITATQNLTDLTDPQKSLVYLYSTNSHMGSALGAADAQTLLSWIQAAAKACPPNGSNPPPSCANTDNFNLGVFRDEIMPILDGTVDLNSQDGNGAGQATGCTRPTCHGNATFQGAGKLYLTDSQSAAQNLADFSCYVNLTNPSQSAALLCPLNAPGCPKQPHPGGSVFIDGTDLNYQRVLSFIYAASKASPFDFAFFVRKINPIFSNPQAVQGGAQAGLTCANATSCHGVETVGQPPPNGSNFPILVNANDVGGLTNNFVTAGSFASFLTPDQSSLFLYPTNEIQQVDGIPHPGGMDFAPDSQFAKDILQWAGGLRPDGNGANRNWLVAGDYTATQITDTTPIDESQMDTPKIFDTDGQSQFNAGQWDGLFSGSDTIDLGQEFPRAANTGRVAYAVAYVINTTPTDINASIQVNSPDDVEIFAGAQQSQGIGGNGTNITVNFPSFDTNQQVTRLMIKVFQPANVQAFTFSTVFTNADTNVLLTDATKELVFTLGPQGGI